jgi:hypothetical protein
MPGSSNLARPKLQNNGCSRKGYFMRTTHGRRLAGLLLACGALTGAARGEDFRIESKVYAGKDKQPVSQSTTLFRAGIVYDYLAEPPRVAVFDKARGRFILLDTQRRLKTEVKTDEVTAFTKGLQELTSRGSDAFLKFQANPIFEPQLDEKTGELVLSSQSMTYRLETIKAQSDEAAQQYREFSDWYTRLNAMINPGINPPFARLAVNDELARRGLIASEVSLTVASHVPSANRGPLRSEHRFAWRLLPRDLSRIADTGNQLASFKSVTLAEFRNATAGK